MNGAQEVDYSRGGACLVLSWDGPQKHWSSDKGCGRSGVRKRNNKLQFWISSSLKASRADGEQRLLPRGHPLLGQRGTRSQWNSRQEQSRGPPPLFLTATPKKTLSFPDVSNPICQPTAASLTLLAATLDLEWLTGATWTPLKNQDLIGWIVRDTNGATRTQVLAMPEPQVSVILYDGDCTTLPVLLHSMDYTRDCELTDSILGYRVAENSGESCDLKKCEDMTTENTKTKTLKTAMKPVRGRRKRKYVSFGDEVTVYLFDQESPTMSLQSINPPSKWPPRSFPHGLRDPSLDDGFEWEDDFSALDLAFATKRNGHQRITRPAPGAPSLSRQRSTASPTHVPQRYFVSASCLFLTHVTESDLEP